MNQIADWRAVSASHVARPPIRYISCCSSVLVQDRFRGTEWGLGVGVSKV